jgi:hypothetical protein
VISTYKLSYMCNFFIGSLHQAFLEAWYRFKDDLIDAMFSSFSDGYIVSLGIVEIRCITTHSCVNISSGFSESSPMRSIPLVKRALSEHNV